MDIVQIVILSLVQGISEFLPISSSAHLVLVPKLFGWQDQGLAFDVAVHVGTLVAILFYFKDRIFKLLSDFLSSIRQRKMVGESMLVYAVGFATIPAGIFGLACGDLIEQYARSGFVIATTTIIFGIMLYLADKSPGLKSEANITIKIALIIGVAQALALIPGVSRSGITITAALFLGFNRITSANFSFLMSIPIILLAGGLETIKLIKSNTTYEWTDLGLAFVLSAVSAYICVKLFMGLISRASMVPFVVYRLMLGVFLFYVFI
ncbi:undecaprenyl-diphosphate phosphatase [Campylobacter sp. RM9344]|uniref:Undecaprenyl-diphosphatase n=1 Tax=Campylobacter californiensis TaxID=1032243 RepID=A0AAW3ZSU6_9BACT|nr:MULTISPECIES: undecaprenyl-diphosphate phosphatase [unclassified Campylobacter]MBE2985216.1 undecaprenyl-diphosphate phosphatase [Campylobacter sp. RM6883]MBE2986958.1 undecaprenyl-diphosphate phosphatase [Campylobacter sp. RM12919]MBE2988603.1 undecaprenyl-diphosphate phosphatase [Campylobacter sp. RM12920]MBE2995293.1 undecaprenyl-diphosphate phosphatase [Campylobacter sp. RM6913]MBE3022022.1 undecaprenyl-diphosphate phosphatase [Campylobacter sp. 7477a]MBE3029935.1 undecaprenyl-diphosph